MKRWICAVGLLLLSCAAFADENGSSQIVTPQVLPAGVATVTFKGTESRFDRPWRLVTEAGVTDKITVGYTHRFAPKGDSLSVEAALFQYKNCQVSAGVLNWSLTHGRAQPFFEEGGSRGKLGWTLGGLYGSRRFEPLVGVSYPLGRRVTLLVDHQGGEENASTVGLNYAVSPTLSVKPAVYVSNCSDHHASAFLSLSWRTRLFK